MAEDAKKGEAVAGPWAQARRWGRPWRPPKKSVKPVLCPPIQFSLVSPDSVNLVPRLAEGCRARSESGCRVPSSYYQLFHKWPVGQADLGTFRRASRDCTGAGITQMGSEVTGLGATRLSRRSPPRRWRPVSRAPIHPTNPLMVLPIPTIRIAAHTSPVLYLTARTGFIGEQRWILT